jgi:hypothetical protein
MKVPSRNSIKSFGKDFVAQNAYYHLGESYLNTDIRNKFGFECFGNGV